MRTRRSDYSREDVVEALDDGKVVVFGTPSQMGFHFRKDHDVGQKAYHFQHPQSVRTYYNSLEGKLMAHGLVAAPGVSVTEIISLKEAHERGVFRTGSDSS